MTSSHSPNLFLIGAPKSGTTTLYQWLRTHPQIFMSLHKEPAYFCRFGEHTWNGPGADLFERGFVASIEAYEALFAGASGYRWRGEASTDYLWVEEVPERIAERYGTERLRFLAVLRDPVERAFSEHGHLIREGLEDSSFTRALEKEDARFRARWHPLFYHRRRGLYSEGLSRYFSIFGRESVKVVSHDDLRRHPGRVFAEIAAFLGVKARPVPLDVVHNRSGAPRSRLVHTLLRRHSPRWLGRTLGPSLSGRLRAVIESANLRPLTMTDAERQRAALLFADDLEATETLLGMRVRASSGTVASETQLG